MKIIRTLEELDELENGKGLKLIVHASSFKGCVWVKIYYNTWLEIKDIENFNESDINLLKAMGFEFEWKPKRTLEEVLEEYKGRPFEYGDANFYVSKSQTGEYEIEISDKIMFVGTKYYSRLDAKKICDELNS